MTEGLDYLLCLSTSGANDSCHHGHGHPVTDKPQPSSYGALRELFTAAVNMLVAFGWRSDVVHWGARVPYRHSELRLTIPGTCRDLDRAML